MGTLGHQPERRHYSVESNTLDFALGHYIKLAKKHGCALSDVIALKAALEAERATTVAVNDGDFRDEHMGGFGELLRELIDSLNDHLNDHQ